MDKQADYLIEKIYKKHKIQNILALEKDGRDKLITMIRAIPGTSIRQISRVTGVPISVVRYIE